MGEIIDGKRIAQEIKDELKAEIAEACTGEDRPLLAVIRVGDDAASAVYVRNKEQACAYIGMRSASHHLPADTKTEELLSLIARCNEDETVDGILVQLPLPAQIDEQEILRAIDPKKDVDGFHPVNAGALMLSLPGFAACTPAGVIELLKRTQIPIAGKRCVIVGRSDIVGKPLALMMLRENATVTVAHSKTKDLSALTRQAEILVVATGRAHMIGRDDVSEGCVVIDVGITRDEKSGKLLGDVDFDAVYDKVSYITPVPGGVGPMTIAMLMKNTWEAYRRKHDLS